MTVQQQIKDTIEQIVALEKVEKHLFESKKSLKQEQDKLKELGKILDKELRDFEKMQELSIKGLFHKILGNKEEQLEIERQEYLKAHLEYKAAEESIHLLEYELSVLVGKTEQLPALAKHLTSLKRSREQEILRLGGEAKTKLLVIFGKMDQTLQYAKEVGEAHLAGEESLRSLDTVLKHLGNALRWANMDMMQGRRNRSYDYHKRSAIDHAMQAANQARRSLDRFAQELSDIKVALGNYDLNIGDWGRFTNLFFDNMITDWIVQNQISNTKNAVSGVADKVRRILQTLAHEQQKINNQMRELELAKDQILLE